ALPDFGVGKLTARTDYIVNGPHDCWLFLSAQDTEVHTKASDQDRAFAARTTDGGKTFQFLGWITGKPRAIRSVMPATVRTPDGSFISIVRRRFDMESDYLNAFDFLDAFGSRDGGVTWKFLSRVAY